MDEHHSVDDAMTPASRFAGGTAVITGAGSGIGAALAHVAVDTGMRVVLAEVDTERLESVRAALAEQGADVVAVPTDVSDPAAVDRLADAAYERFGSVRLLVNNAGIESIGPIWEMTPEHWNRVQRINVDGVFHGIRSFVPRMGRDPEPAAVVNMASIGIITSSPLNGAYHAAKHAVLGMTESLYLECRQRFDQVSVSVACPAAVSTQIFTDALADPEQTSSSGTGAMLDAMRGHVRDDGITPRQAAEAIIAGAASGRFWIHTHPERFAELAADRASMLMNSLAPGENVTEE